MSDSIISLLTGTGGENLAVRDWPLPSGVPLRGVVVLVHGLGEHSGRYDHVAQYLNALGFAVRGYDQYGHGDSGGVRGTIPSPMRLVTDLADIVDNVQAVSPKGTPLILLGHSMGGLVAARFVSQRLRPVDALVLSSPALGVRLGGFEKLMLRVLPQWLPNLPLTNGVKPQYLSRDPAVVAAYVADRLVHKRMSPRLARFIVDAGEAVRAVAGQWSTNTLLLYAGQDRVVLPSASAEFARLAPADAVKSRCLDDLYHEIFNEPEQAEVLAFVGRWLERHLG